MAQKLVPLIFNKTRASAILQCGTAGCFIASLLGCDACGGQSIHASVEAKLLYRRGIPHRSNKLMPPICGLSIHACPRTAFVSCIFDRPPCFHLHKMFLSGSIHALRAEGKAALLGDLDTVVTSVPKHKRTLVDHIGT